MINKSIRKLWLICLLIASLTLVGCFHIPDDDWLLSDKDKVDTWDTEKQNEIDQAMNSFMEWIDLISSDKDEVKDTESSVETWIDNIIFSENEINTWNDTLE